MQLILKYSKSFSCLQILSVVASRGLCIPAKQASVQQDICYIFLDGLLTLEQKKKMKIAPVTFREKYVSQTWTSLRGCFFSSLFFSWLSVADCALPVQPSGQPCYSATHRAALVRALPPGWRLHRPLPWRALASLSFLDWPWNQHRCVAANVLSSSRHLPFSFSVAVTLGWVSAAQMSPPTLSFVWLGGDLDKIRYPN